MNCHLSVRAEAESDISEYFNYYEERRPGLGHDFLGCVEEGILKIETNPLGYRKVYKELRRIAIRRFPYRIFYFIEGQQITVTAIFHAQKNPGAWASRI